MNLRTPLLALAGMLCAGPVLAQETHPAAAHQRAVELLESDPELRLEPRSLLVRFAPGSSELQRAELRGRVGAGRLRRFELVEGLELIDVAVPLGTALEFLRPHVLYAEPDWVVRKVQTPNDPYFNLEWGLHNSGQTVNGDPGTAGADINAPLAWDTTTGNPDLVIAIIDTGTQWSHPDLAANIWSNPGEVAGNGLDDDGNGYVDDVRGWDFYSVDNNPDDSDGHGTHTAGTVGAIGNNGTGVAGVNWRCKLMPLRFIGPYGGYTSDAVLAVQYAARMGVKVSCNSWGGGGFSQALYDAINASKAVGHVFVAAAGNSSANTDSSPHYPSCYNLDNLLSVAATDNDDGLASFSNYGKTSVDLGAPGVTILSTYKGSGYAYMSGTSMACPHVAGVVALVYGQNPLWSYGQVVDRILSTVRPVGSLAGKCVTGGVLDAAAAVAGGGGPPPNTPPTVTIGSPASGASFALGASVSFAGSASDPEDGDLSASLVWTSSLQGQIGAGPSFSRSDLVAGTHVVSARVTDSGGAQGDDAVTITIVDSNSPPAAPGQPSATKLGSGSVRLSWTDNSSNEGGFDVQREQRVGKSWANTTLAGTTGANVTTLVDSPGRGSWRYRVRAFNAAGSSAWSTWRTVKL